MCKKDHFRTSKRPQLTHPVILRSDRPETRVVNATTRDVSTGGLFVYTTEPFELGDHVTVELATPSTWEPIFLKAKVCRLSPTDTPSGIGLQFVDTSDADLVALIQLISMLDFES